MLVITRNEGESFSIDEDVKIHIVRVGRGRVRVGIEAPRDRQVRRDDAKRISPRPKPASPA